MLTVGVDGINLATRWRYIGAVEQDEGTDILASRISAFSYIDTTLNFDVADRFTFRIGVQNLFDKDPPLVGGGRGGDGCECGEYIPDCI